MAYDFHLLDPDGRTIASSNLDLAEFEFCPEQLSETGDESAAYFADFWEDAKLSSAQTKRLAKSLTRAAQRQGCPLAERVFIHSITCAAAAGGES